MKSTLAFAALALALWFWAIGPMPRCEPGDTGIRIGHSFKSAGC